MYLTWVKKYLIGNAGLIACFLLLLILAIQYPFSSTFPMGGDAPAYISDSKELLNVFHKPTDISALLRSWYPFANLLFLPFSLLPVSWPMRFILWATLGQIATGCALSWFMYRLAGKGAAAAGLAIWAVTPIIATTHFEDGTIAQLWSYAFIFIFLERFISHSRWALLFLILTLSTHAVAGLPLTIAVAAALLAIQFNRRSLVVKEKKLINSLTPFVGLLVFTIGILLVLQRQALAFIQPNGTNYFQSFLELKFLPIIVIAPFGIIPLWEKLYKKHSSFILINTFLSTFILFAFNNLLGIGIWGNRFLPLAVLSTTILASIALPHILSNVFANKYSRIFAALCLLVLAGSTTWQNNAHVYSIYESPSRYMRIHPAEAEAIHWMNKNFPKNSRVIASSANRHSEWIAALTSLKFTSVPTDVVQKEARLQEFIGSDSALYITYFLRREDLPQFMINQPEKYSIVYNENKVNIVKVEPK